MRNKIQDGAGGAVVEEANGRQAGWRLPSGEDLISFALGVGLAAGPLVRFPAEGPEPSESLETAPRSAPPVSALPDPSAIPGLKG
ncbi:MAG: hypothetical protein KJZ84_13520 [Bryobacteraceae bacterium]|nr:hypothetical protein [Bryobacteraceae bacterium]